MRTLIIAAALAASASTATALPTSTDEFMVTTMDTMPGTDIASPDQFDGRTRGLAKPSPVMSDMFGYDEFGRRKFAGGLAPDADDMFGPDVFGIGRGRN